jgi:hypothetical protein
MKKIFPLFIVLFIFSCSESEKQNIRDLDWIIGQWTSTSGDDSMTEHWQKNDNLLIGEAWFISSSDTIATEQLKIVERDNNIFYIASPSDQETTEFKLTEFNADEALFENPDHDFPRKIFYKRISVDSLYARVEGIIHGQQQVMDFYWKKTGK